MDLKRIIPLVNVREGNDKDRRQQLGRKRVKMDHFYKQFNEPDIQQDANEYAHQVAEQLVMRLDRGIYPDDITAHKETRGKTQRKGYQEGCNVRGESIKGCHYIPRTEEVMICYVKKEGVKHQVDTAAGHVEIFLPRNEFKEPSPYDQKYLSQKIGKYGHDGYSDVNLRNPPYLFE